MNLGLSVWQYVIIFGFSFLFGGLKSGFGVAGALVTPALSLLINPKLAVALLGPIGVWTDVAALRNHWRKWDSREIWRLLPATVVGTILGSMVLAGVSARFLNRTLAVITLTYGVVQIIKERQMQSAAGQEAAPAGSARRRNWLTSAPSALVIGLAGGLIGALSHAGGLILTFYLLAVGLQKDSYIATLVSLFFAQNLLKVPMYWAVGVLSLSAFGLAVLTIPVVFAGGWVGKRINRKLSHKQFTMVLNAIILVMGVILLFK